MPSHAGLASSSKRHSPKTSSPIKTLQQDAFREPNSPSRGSVERSQRQVTQERQGREDLQIARGTFLEDITPVGSARNPDDGEDPHDLSLSPKYIPRASMVDYMVRSLDQFSNDMASVSYNNSPNVTSRFNLGESTRGRGHTFSSSMSSEGELREDRNWPQSASSAVRVARRNSTAKYNRQKLPSIFGEDEDSTRAKVYDAQRAAPKIVSKRQKKANNGSKGSNSSSVDLGHLAKFHGRLGPAGNRRSQSFDFGSSRPKELSLSLAEAIDVAAPPVVFAGPESQQTPSKEIFQSPLGRRNSTKSSKSAHAKRPKPGTLGTSTIRAISNDQMPGLPTVRSSPALTSVMAEQRAASNSAEALPSPRPGFFRRVFGSSKPLSTYDNSPSQNNSSRSLTQGRGTPVVDEDSAASAVPSRLQKPMQRRDSVEPPAGKENQTIAKKSSAFFRRRKKSVSNIPPPPLPLNLNHNLSPEHAQLGEASPVSSLRVLMGPYLGEKDITSPLSARFSNDGPAFHTAHSTPQLTDSVFDEPAKRRPPYERQGLSTDSQSKLQIPETKPRSTLRVPHHDSFLADSSSAEELNKRSTRTSPTSDRPHADSLSLSPTESVHRVPSNQSSIVNTTLERPIVQSRQDSWRSDKSQGLSPRPATAAPQSTKPRPRLDLSTSRERLRAAITNSTSPTAFKDSPHASASDISEYRSAPSTPLSIEHKGKPDNPSPYVHVSHPSVAIGHTVEEMAKAQRIYNNEDDEVEPGNASAWLAEAGSERERIRKAYMKLFNWTGLNILASLRDLCDRIALKGETQQVDRMIDAFACRWCECNSNHGFKSSDVVHTICYSLLLLNTDLHLADIGQKMTRSQFVRNALPTIKRVAEQDDSNGIVRAYSPSVKPPPQDGLNVPRRTSVDQDSSPGSGFGRHFDRPTKEDSGDLESTSGPLVDAPFIGSEKGWDSQIEAVLKSFYLSISRQRLPLFGAPAEPNPSPAASGTLLSMTSNMLRRTPSTLSKNQPETLRGRLGGDARSLGGRFASKGRSRARLTPTPGFGSSRTSLDEQSSGWSPSMSSTWSKASLGKTLTSVSVDSFGSEATKPDYQSSIGFASALSQAIIREDQLEFPIDEGLKAGPLLEDDSLELCGAPWAKEGIMKHKCHLEGVDKRSKDRNWEDCFAVIEKGWMRLFSFSMNAKSLRQKAKNQKAGGVVGGGNWQDNAEEVWKFLLRHTIASTLPPPGYSKARPFVWALSLPTGAVHLFSVGTPDIVKEFVSTANYWSARLSKEPMMGGISNMEYGWSDAVINRALIASDSQPVHNRVGPSPRPSTQMSIRTSLDQGTGVVRPKLPGDKVYINDWVPPQQSMMASQLMEVDQLKGLQTYVKAVEEDLKKHNELRGPMLLAFSTRHPNSTKAMSNWEKKSSYLLREIVKFGTYIDNLDSAQSSRERVYAMRREDEENRRQEDDSKALGAETNYSA